MHVADERQFLLRVLVGMTVRLTRLTGQRLDAPVKSRLPVVNVRPTSVVPAAGLGYTMLFNICHQGVAVFHVLCYTVHEA